MKTPTPANAGPQALTPADPVGLSEASARRPSAEEVIVNWLVKAVADLTSMKPQDVNIRLPFTYYGLDSVQMIKLSGNLERWLRRELSPALAYDYPTIEALARHLAGDATSAG
jgi:acyl carrier protein